MWSMCVRPARTLVDFYAVDIFQSIICHFVAFINWPACESATCSLLQTLLLSDCDSLRNGKCKFNALFAGLFVLACLSVCTGNKKMIHLFLWKIELNSNPTE